MPITVEDVISLKVLDLAYYPTALAFAAFAIYSAWYGLWDAFTLVSLCGVSVSGGRLLQSEFLRRCRDQPATFGCPARLRALQTLLILLLMLFIQILVSPNTPALLASRWYLSVVTVLLAAAFEIVGTPRVELSEALAESQVNYAQGAAWGFFIGYLLIQFGDSAVDVDGAATIESRMTDYLASQNVREDQDTTFKQRMIILVPIKHEALLNDRDFSHNDKHITKEMRLKGSCTRDGRVYGETQVYKITSGHRRYRVAMEEATPIRTAALAVEDAAVEDFDKNDFEEFARRFLRELQTILRNKPDIGDQVELVPIEDMRNIGTTVAQRIRELEQLEHGRADPELAHRLSAAGSLAVRQPEQREAP